MLQQLHVVFFDTVRVEEDLERIPGHPIRWNRRGNALGTGPGGTASQTGGEGPEGMISSLHKHLKILKTDLFLLKKDVQREIERLAPEDLHFRLEPQLFRLEKELFHLENLIEQIEREARALTQNRGREIPEAFQHSNDQLIEWLQKMELILGPTNECVC